MGVFDGYTRTTENQSVRDRLQVKGGADEQQPGVLIKDVAESLCIHPFMLSRWRKEVRDGELVGRPARIDSASVAELRRLREVEQQFKRLRMEHDLLKKLPGLPRIEGRNLCVHRGKPELVRDPRHVWATRYVQNGTPLFALQELGGWESAEMVRRYAHLAADHLAPYAERLGAVRAAAENDGTNTTQS